MPKLNHTRHDGRQTPPVEDVVRSEGGDGRIHSAGVSAGGFRRHPLWSTTSASALVTTGMMPHPWTVTWVRAEPRSLRSVLANAAHDATLRATWRRRSNCRIPSFRTRRRTLLAIAHPA